MAPWKAVPQGAWVKVGVPNTSSAATVGLMVNVRVAISTLVEAS